MDRILNFTENVPLPAQEGGIKDVFADKIAHGSTHLLKKLTVLLGLTTLVIGGGKQIGIKLDHDKRLNMLSDAERESHRIFVREYRPEIDKLRDVISHDIDTINKKNGIKKYIAVSFENSHVYNSTLVKMKYDSLYESILSDESDHEETLKFYKCMTDLRPYIAKWKDIASKFSPEFSMHICSSEDMGDPDAVHADLGIVLYCEYLEKYCIMKPGLRHLS